MESNNSSTVFGRILALVTVGVALLLIAMLGRDADSAEPVPTEEQSTSAEPITPTATAAFIAQVVSAEFDDQPAQVFDLAGVPRLQEQAISAQLNPRTYQGKTPEHEFQTYIVVRGDTPVRIAERFNIKPETLLGGNPQLSEESNLLQIDDELIILPVDGVLHDVSPGESLESISALYDVPVDDIIGYTPNNLEFPYRLYPGTQVLVPGAVRDLFVWEPPSLESVRSSNSYWAGQAQPLIVGTGTFVWPVGARRITQVYWYGHQAIDVGLVEGSPVYASDSGTVTYAAWSPYCFGNLIVVNHGNGFETFYAHLSSINVVPGQIVYQGNVIGASGNTGCSSGPHIHFEIRVNGNRDDPIWWLP